MDFQSLVERKLDPVGKSNNEVIYRCPLCEGSEGSGHLYVNYQRGKFNCFKCDLGGKRIEGLLRILNIDLNYDYEKLYSEQDKDLDSIISMKTSTKKVEKEVLDYSTDLSLLTEYYNLHTMPLTPTAYTYLIERGMTPSLINMLGMREGVNRYGEEFILKGKKFEGRDYSGRIMIPSIKGDHISFYLGRDYLGYKSNKYSNAPKELAVASEDVWNLDLVETDSVIICEGVFSAIAVNQALGKMIACATYGKSIAKNSSDDSIRVTSQGEKLLEKKFKSYIIFYDKDASEDAYKNAYYLSDRGANVKVVRIPEDMYGPKADAGDMKAEEIIECIKKAEEFDRFSGLL